MSKTNIYFDPATKENWQGRASSDAYSKQYWHEAIEIIDKIEENNLPKIAILGFACDEGVRRNHGRIGAAKSPTIIRQRLAKLAFHINKRIGDFGDLICKNQEMEISQSELSNRVAELIKKHIFTMVLGGGHEVAFGHGEGILLGAKAIGIKKIGIINFDAHFDLRPPSSESNSGTPFYQLLKKYPRDFEYLAIGIQKDSNPRQLFDIAKELNVRYIQCNNCVESQTSVIVHEVENFIQRQDAIYISIDLDGFSSNFAPGVSAPSPMGFSPNFILPILNNILSTKKVLACDIAELNPNYDIDNCTANLAARLVNYICERV